MGEVIAYVIVGFAFIGGLFVVADIVGKSHKSRNKPKDYYNE